MGLFGWLGFKGGASGSRQTQTSTSSIDDITKQHQNSIWGAGQAAGANGPGPLLTGAGQYGTAAQDAGNLGFGALTGSNPAAMQGFMNPYQQNVIDANNAQWQKTNAQTANQVDDMATRANAFGGSRYGVALGTALANNNMAQQSQDANLRQSNFANAQGVAQNMAGMGFQGAGMNTNLGFGGVGNPDLWRMMMMKQGYMGPQGSTTGTNTSNVSGGFSIG